MCATVGGKATRRPKAPLAAAMSLVLCLLALGCGATATSSGQCAGPSLEVEPARAAPGEPFQVRGENFFKGCDDTGSDETEKPRRNVRVVFVQGDQRWKLATVDANRNFAFDAKLKVPADAAPGRAVVSAKLRSQGPYTLADHPFQVVGDD